MRTTIALLLLLQPPLLAQQPPPHFLCIYRDSLKQGVDSSYSDLGPTALQASASGPAKSREIAWRK